jgi:hypothetical protein
MRIDPQNSTFGITNLNDLVVAQRLLERPRPFLQIDLEANLAILS